MWDSTPARTKISTANHANFRQFVVVKDILHRRERKARRDL